jgi:hypothetical protein
MARLLLLQLQPAVRHVATLPSPALQGVPYNCNQAGQMCSKSERYPGMWQVPLYETSDHNLMDYCTNENTGAPRPGCSAFKALKEQFDDSYNGNRAPTQILIHTPYLQHKQYYNDVKKFLQYAMAKPGVWAVTMSQLLDWMEAPVPAAMVSACAMGGRGRQCQGQCAEAWPPCSCS